MELNTNKITLWTVIANMLIVIGAGHGIGFMLMIETILVIVHKDPLFFSLKDSYDHLLFTSALFSLIGQGILILSMIVKNMDLVFKVAGIMFLYIGLLYLGVNCWRDQASQLSLFCSVPFMILSIILLFKQVSLKYKAKIDP